MSKRIFAILLCVLMLVPCLAACSTVSEDNPGAYITMYLSDEIYDFDPANAYYNNGTANVVSLLFETLFVLDEKGRVKEALAKDYEIIEDEEANEYSMLITLNKTCWSNNQALSAEDVVFAWRRLLNQENSYEAASLLFDIKNARAVKEGDEAIDDLGVEALEPTILKITFEGKIDYDQFLLNLTSIATAPLPESYVAKNPDWAKKSSTIITSGPFKLGKIKYATTGDKVEDDNALNADGELDPAKKYNVAKLEYFYLERNRYYYRNDTKDNLDKYVTPYRILVDCTPTDEEILQSYQDNKLFYISDIPMSLRQNSYIKENAEVSNALSTTTLFLNENVAPFNIPEVRQALSLVIDRDAIANAVVFAKAATALVPDGVMNDNPGKKAAQFRDEGGALIETTANKQKAQEYLTQANVKASDYSFSIKVAAYDDVNIAVAEMVAEAWKSLGFKVTVEKVQTIQNNDYLKSQEEAPSDVCDDLFLESIARNKFEVILYDYTAFSASAYSMLANFAKPFSGMALNRYNNNGQMVYELTPNRTGYDSVLYNYLIEAVYYVPYFASLTKNDYQAFGEDFYTPEEFEILHSILTEIYAQNGITPTTNPKEWSKQQAKLLHAAEAQLMKDMPVIPLIFNQTATLTSKELKGIDATYYGPDFKELNLKSYNDYTYTIITRDENGTIIEEKTVSIFDDFPNIPWDKIGTTEEENSK